MAQSQGYCFVNKERNCFRVCVAYICSPHYADLQVLDDMVDNEHTFTFGSFPDLSLGQLARRQYPG